MRGASPRVRARGCIAARGRRWRRWRFVWREAASCVFDWRCRRSSVVGVAGRWLQRFVAVGASRFCVGMFGSCRGAVVLVRLLRRAVVIARRRCLGRWALCGGHRARVACTFVCCAVGSAMRSHCGSRSRCRGRRWALGCTWQGCTILVVCGTWASLRCSLGVCAAVGHLRRCSVRGCCGRVRRGCRVWLHGAVGARLIVTMRRACCKRSRCVTSTLSAPHSFRSSASQSTQQRRADGPPM